MNAPAAFESFLIFDGEKKVTFQKDTKVPNAAIFTINKEDHTLGNLIKQLVSYSLSFNFSFAMLTIDLSIHQVECLECYVGGLFVEH